MYIGLRVKYPLFLSGFNEPWIFPTGFRKILRHQISRKSIQWAPSSSMRSDRHDEANTVRDFLNFAKAHKNLCKKCVLVLLVSLSLIKLRDEFTSTLPSCSVVTVQSLFHTHTHTHTHVTTHKYPHIYWAMYGPTRLRTKRNMYVRSE